jgi:hypothetical protein
MLSTSALGVRRTVVVAVLTRLAVEAVATRVGYWLVMLMLNVLKE